MVPKIVVWLKRADIRLQETAGYFEKIAGKRVADKIVGKLQARAVILERNPLAGPREELLAGRSQEFRYLVQGNYKIIYFVKDEKVYIATIFDCRQDPEKIKDEM